MHPIYFLHGLGQTPDSWDKVLAQLELENSVCPDLAALCRGKQATYPGLYEGFSKLCSQADGPIHLCGLSLGGVLALNYAIEHPERVGSLVLIAPQYKMPKGLLRLQNFLFHFMPKSMFQQMGFGKQEFIQLCRSMMELDFSGAVQKIACPTLILCGERDTANKKACGALAGLLKDAEFQVVGGSGHEVNVEAPEALAESLRTFYERIR